MGILRWGAHDQGTQRKLKFQDKRDGIYWATGTDHSDQFLWALVKIFV